MKLLMPSHVKRVKQHTESTPLFQRAGAEDQLSAMYQPVVQLKSGGYLVINPTEALVSIDINSGRSTREHNIEQTAYNTNLEAAQEIARQLRLRDMAGLIVIDFIDMEQSSHVRKVEKAMKEALKNDRARIQVGRISSFGLMEMSRQRLRTGVLEASTKPCPHCEGTGLMRTAASAGLSALRFIEDEAARGRGERVLLRAGRDAAVYVLNKKRAELAEIEERYGVSVEIAIDESFEGAKMSVESSGPKPIPQQRAAPVVESPEEDEDELDAALVGAEGEDEEDEREDREDREDREERDEGPQERGARRRRRRRRGGRGRRRGGQEGMIPADEVPPAIEESGESEPADEVQAEEQPPETGEEAPKKGRRRRKPKAAASDTPEAGTVEVEPDSSPMVERPIDEEPPIAETEAAPEAKPKKPRRSRKKEETPAAAVEVAEPAPADDPPAETSTEAEAKPKRRTRKKAAEPAEAKEAASVPEADNDSNGGDEGGKPRSGWWQRTFG
jgi:ribonuclease E